MVHAPNAGSTIFIVALMAWGIYRRVRRSIGRQPLRRGRITLSLVVLSLVTVVLFILLRQHPHALLALGGGMALGATLGFIGLKLTRFETTDQGHFYFPNTYIGLALSVLFIGRVAYNQWTRQQAALADSHPQLFQSPLTLFIVGLNLGYGLTYYVGLLVHTHDKNSGVQSSDMAGSKEKK